MRVKRRYTYPETATAVNAFDPRPPRLAAALAQDVRYLTLCIELGDARVLVPVGDIQPTQWCTAAVRHGQKVRTRIKPNI